MPDAANARTVLSARGRRGFCARQDLSDRSVTPQKGETPNLMDTLGLRHNPLAARSASQTRLALVQWLVL